MTSPINRMIDAVVQCTKCGTQGVGNCDCWVHMHCPNCNKTSNATARDETDPPGMRTVVVSCPDCGDEGGITYLDKAGNEIEVE